MQASEPTTVEISFDSLREGYARSEFEQLFFAGLPHGNTRNMTRILKYKVATDEDVKKIQRIRDAVLANIAHQPDFQWTDESKF